MATRRRDTMAGKEKRTIPSPSALHSTKTPSTSASATSIHPKLHSTTATRADASKKTSTVDKTKAPLEKKTQSLPQTLKTTPAPKTTHVSTNPPPRPSSLPSKIVASQKPAQDINKNIKAPVRPVRTTVANRSVRPVGTAKTKQGSQNTASVTNVKEGCRTNTIPGINTKKQGSLNTTSAIKGRSRSVPPPKKVGHKNVSEVKCPDPEFFLNEIDDLTVEDLRSNDELEFEEKGLSIEKMGDENDAKDAPVDVKTEVEEEKRCIDEVGNEQLELEKHTTNEVKSVADDADGEVEDEINEFGETEVQKEVEEKQQEPEENADPEQETVEENMQESENAVLEQEIDEKQELENEPTKQEIIEEKNQESENESPKQEVIKEKKQEPAESALKLPVQQMKKGGSPVSNDVIEETAIKLREQRKNKVLALAKAFESVMTSP